MNKLIQFLGHFLRAKTRHGTHSPFVYALVDRCIYQNIEIPEEVKKHFERLKQSNKKLVGMDFGKGSKMSYRVADMARKSASMNFETDLLSRLARYHGAQSFLELGSNLGKSAAHVASVNSQMKVVGIEGMKSLAALAMQNIESLNISNVEIKPTTFDDFFRTNTETFDMIFIDGDHRYQPTLDNYESSKKVLKGEGPIVLHDIYWSEGMTQAWEKIKADNDATVTIDLFFFGLVYFRKGQVKEHFDIRFPSNPLSLLL